MKIEDILLNGFFNYRVFRFLIGVVVFFFTSLFFFFLKTLFLFTNSFFSVFSITNHFYEHSLLLFVLFVDFAFEEGGCGTLKFLLLRFPVPPDVECLPTYAAGGPFT